jgi:hypothetical protein
MSLTVGAQQALFIAQQGVNQVGGVTAAVTSNFCNTLINTDTYTGAAGTSWTFPYESTLIGDGTIVSCVLTQNNGTTGNPVVSISGQNPGVTYITVTNNHPTDSLNGNLAIAALVYPAVSTR